MSAIARFLILLPLFGLALILPAAAECTDWDQVLPLVGSADGATNLQRVAVTGSWALAIDETGYVQRALLVYSLHDPEAPELVNSLPLPDWTGVIVCRGDLAFLAGRNTLGAYDISSPATPQLISQIAVPGEVCDLDLDGDLCALAADEAGLVLVDVSDPQFLTIRGSFVPPSWQGDSRGVDLRGDRVLLSLDDVNDGYLYWCDVSDPGEPTVLQSRLFDRMIQQVQLLDDGLALATSHSSLHTLAVSDTEPITLLGSSYAAGLRLLRFDDLALSMYTYDGDALLMDLTDPVTPRWLAPLESFAFDAVRKSQYLILARGPAGLGVARITDPDAVPILGVEPTPMPSAQLFVTDDPDLVLALDPTSDRVSLLDVSVPDQPTVRSTLPLEGPSWAAIQGSQAVVLAEDGAQLLYLAYPDNIATMGPVALPANTERVTWTGDLYYVAAGADGLVIMDATVPRQPVELGRLDTSGSVRNTVLTAGVAVIGDNASGIRTVDVSDPTAPVELGHVGGVHGDLLIARGQRCFTGGWLADVVAEVDITDPTAPVVAATIPLPARPDGILLNGDLLWTASYAGVDVFDIADPGSPSPVSRLGGRPRAYGLAPVADGAATCLWQFVTLRPPCVTLTAVTEPARAAGTRLAAAPNPCNPLTRLSFTLPRAGACRLDIHDLAGRRLRTLWRGHLDAGPHSFAWDGRDGSRRLAASGVYVARLAATGLTATTRVVLVR